MYPMNTNMTQTDIAPAKKVYSVAGADIDLDMLRVLVQGDRVLAEINGVRPFSTATNSKVADDAPWTVEFHEVGEFLVLSNPRCSVNLRLDYSELITSGESQPAVFQLRNKSGWVSAKVPRVFVVLQLISCKVAEDGIDSLFGQDGDFDADELLDVYDDERVYVGLMEAWAAKLKRFTPGWRMRSVKRFALRADVTQRTVDAFRTGDWDTVLALKETPAGRKTLLGMARELHALPVLLAHARIEGTEQVATVPALKETGGVR
jgi:hypothetical protein